MFLIRLNKSAKLLVVRAYFLVSYNYTSYYFLQVPHMYTLAETLVLYREIVHLSLQKCMYWF
jgi:hypothetical protein